MADMISLSEALASVGFRCIGLPWSTDVIQTLETARADEKTDLGLKLLILLIKFKLYPIPTFKIPRIVLLRVSKYSKNNLT